MPGDASVSNRYLVQSDYGMGALLWWITAPSEEDILDTFAEVEIIRDDERIDLVSTGEGQPAEVAIEGPYPPGLDGLHEKRMRQRQEVGYGVLAGAERVYLKRPDPEDDGTVWYSELGSDGRRLREIERLADGSATGYSQWIMNPPEDLRDPESAGFTCTAEEFESVWRSATLIDD